MKGHSTLILIFVSVMIEVINSQVIYAPGFVDSPRIVQMPISGDHFRVKPLKPIRPLKPIPGPQQVRAPGKDPMKTSRKAVPKLPSLDGDCVAEGNRCSISKRCCQGYFCKSIGKFDSNSVPLQFCKSDSLTTPEIETTTEPSPSSFENEATPNTFEKDYGLD